MLSTPTRFPVCRGGVGGGVGGCVRAHLHSRAGGLRGAGEGGERRLCALCGAAHPELPVSLLFCVLSCAVHRPRQPSKRWVAQSTRARTSTTCLLRLHLALTPRSSERVERLVSSTMCMRRACGIGQCACAGGGGTRCPPVVQVRGMEGVYCYYFPSRCGWMGARTSHTTDSKSGAGCRGRRKGGGFLAWCISVLQQHSARVLD